MLQAWEKGLNYPRQEKKCDMMKCIIFGIAKWEYLVSKACLSLCNNSTEVIQHLLLLGSPTRITFSLNHSPSPSLPEKVCLKRSHYKVKETPRFLHQWRLVGSSTPYTLFWDNASWWRRRGGGYGQWWTWKCGLHFQEGFPDRFVVFKYIAVFTIKIFPK